MNPGYDRFLDVLCRHLSGFAPGDILAGGKLLREMGLDSMAAINLLFDLEDAFGIVVPDEYLVDSTFTTSEALWGVVSELSANNDG